VNLFGSLAVGPVVSRCSLTTDCQPGRTKAGCTGERSTSVTLVLECSSAELYSPDTGAGAYVQGSVAECYKVGSGRDVEAAFEGTAPLVVLEVEASERIL